jgi:NAD(P)-dependent dehydrogenase (short-subunit alcohol dehydrogenase family)
MDAAAQEAGVSGSGTFFRAIAPGVVDTPMQEAIRSRGPEQFPMVQRFRDLHASGGLASPEGAAAKLLSLAVQGEEAYLRLDVRTA